MLVTLGFEVARGAGSRGDCRAGPAGSRHLDSGTFRRPDCRPEATPKGRGGRGGPVGCVPVSRRGNEKGACDERPQVQLEFCHNKSKCSAVFFLFFCFFLISSLSYDGTSTICQVPVCMWVNFRLRSHVSPCLSRNLTVFVNIHFYFYLISTAATIILSSLLFRVHNLYTWRITKIEFQSSDNVCASRDLCALFFT